VAEGLRSWQKEQYNIFLILFLLYVENARELEPAKKKDRIFFQSSAAYESATLSSVSPNVDL